jgi:hypothetical protein
MCDVKGCSWDYTSYTLHGTNVERVQSTVCAVVPQILDKNSRDDNRISRVVSTANIVTS